MTARAFNVRKGSALVRGLVVLFALVAASASISYWWVTTQAKSTPTTPPGTITSTSNSSPLLGGDKPIEVGGRPLFADWPKEKPDLVILVSGQMYGYLSPCGCSRPQYGGLERRYNLIQSLKAMGWDVIGVDVGDVAPAPSAKLLSEQALKKYTFAMKALKEMGYVAVGVGKTDFQNQLMQLLGQFTVNNKNERPIILSSNVLAVQRNEGKVVKTTSREDYFKGEPNTRPLVEDVEIVTDKKVSVGVIGMMGPTVGADIVANVDPSHDFDQVATALPAALKKLNTDKAKPELKVLLYQGTRFEAAQVAKDYPEIQLIVAIGDSTETGPPPLLPDKIGNTQIVMVGHKGMNVGLVGVFKTNTGLDLRYQLVPLGEDFLTPEKPEDVAKSHKVLQLLEQYTSEVKQSDFLSKLVAKRGDHTAQVQNPMAAMTYIGAQACAKCHAAEVKKWGETKHAHAYEALEKLAKRPSLRQFDPECVNCHTTGFDYTSGFENETKTKHLLHNGCENCHGPGSAHAAKPNDKTLYKALTPWRLGDDDKRAEDKLPSLEELQKMAEIPEADRGKVAVKPNHQRLKNALSAMCMRCHDGDNDPKFDFWTYIPKIYHSGLKQADLPGGIGK